MKLRDLTYARCDVQLSILSRFIEPCKYNCGRR